MMSHLIEKYKGTSAKDKEICGFMAGWVYAGSISCIISWDIQWNKFDVATM
jgi:hypothetical protein